MESTIEHIKNALNDIGQIELTRNIEILGPLKRYHVKQQWSEYLPNGRYGGVYIYTGLDNKVWYIGKADRKNDTGLSGRTFSHIKPETKDSENMFDQHQWINSKRSRITKAIKQSLRTGDFLVWTWPVKPGYYASFFEVYLQTYCKTISEKLPPLNKQIG